jgi:hypothetical protein
MLAMRYGANANARPATKAAAVLPVSSRPRRNIPSPDSANVERKSRL